MEVIGENWRLILLCIIIGFLLFYVLRGEKPQDDGPLTDEEYEEMQNLAFRCEYEGNLSIEDFRRLNYLEERHRVDRE